MHDRRPRKRALSGGEIMVMLATDCLSYMTVILPDLDEAEESAIVSHLAVVLQRAISLAYHAPEWAAAVYQDVVREQAPAMGKTFEQEMATEAEEAAEDTRNYPIRVSESRR